MTYITTAAALQALEESVTEKGEGYTYQAVVVDGEFNEDGSPYKHCAYVANGAPSCLVGHALHRLGIPLSTLSTFEGNAAIEFRSILAGDDLAWRVLNAAQGVQDEGENWGLALEAAREEAASE